MHELDHVRVDNATRELWIRESDAGEWIAVPTVYMVGQTHVAESGVCVTWTGDDLGVGGDATVLSAFAWDGALRWSLRMRDLPFHERDGVRAPRHTYITLVAGRLRVRNGAWWCELSMQGALGPAHRT